MSYDDLTIKRLYGQSFNECAHPDCRQLMIEIDGNTGAPVNHGEIAHIRARKAGEQRFDASYPNEKLNNEENLILLCAKHHTEIDQKDAEKFYTVELLEKWKTDHYAIKAQLADRNWVFGAHSIHFWIDGASYQLEYWLDKDGIARFFNEDQLKQVRAATDLSLLFAQLGSLISTMDQADGKPENPNRQSMNDAYVRVFKENAENLKRGGYPSFMHRLYENLATCTDVTLAELSKTLTSDKPRTTTLLAGEFTPERLNEVLRKK